MANRKEPDDRSEFLDALRKGVLLGAAILVVVLPYQWYTRQQERPLQPPAVAIVQPKPQAPAPAPQAAPPAPRLAHFGDVSPTPDVKLVADWATHTGDHKKHSFVVIDKKDAQLYVFDSAGRLQGTTPILLGKAIGDDNFPGIGDKPLALVKEEEKTTPAGRFVAEPGRNTKGEDIIWVDYDSAVSMHRLRKVAEKERRYERMASPTKKDNRISFGCINVPQKFYEGVLDPAVKKSGAIVYVVPEVKDIQTVLGAYDVTAQPLVAASHIKPAPLKN
ncbi:MAG: hypothetical protein HY854_22770 [Burkholderiales bacterium]|nr:hypothetical protein [Burkholderiales bacterium]